MNRLIQMLTASIVIIFMVSPPLSAVEKKIFNDRRTFGRALIEKIEHVKGDINNPLVLIIALKLEPGIPITMILNYNPVLSELVQSAIGCIGMFLSMPMTAIICIKLHGRSRAE